MAEMISAMSGAARACQYFLDKNRRYVGKSQPKRTCAPSFGARQTGSAPWAVSGEHERCKGFLAMRGMSVTPAHVVAPIVEVREREGEVLGFACGRGAGATDCQSRAGRRTDVRAAEVAPSPLRAVSDERARIWPGAAASTSTSTTACIGTNRLCVAYREISVTKTQIGGAAAARQPASPPRGSAISCTAGCTQ